MSTQAPSPQSWKRVVLCGHFDYDDVYAISDRLVNWLREQHCQVSVHYRESGEELIVTITRSDEEAVVNREQICHFLEGLHAQPTIHFGED